MNKGVPILVFLLIGIFALFFVLKIVGALVGWIIGLILPIAFVALVAYVLYRVINRKALGGSGRSLP